VFQNRPIYTIPGRVRLLCHALHIDGLQHKVAMSRELVFFLNWVNSRNGSDMMTAPQTLSLILLLLFFLTLGRYIPEGFKKLKKVT